LIALIINAILRGRSSTLRYLVSLFNINARSCEQRTDVKTRFSSRLTDSRRFKHC